MGSKWRSKEDWQGLIHKQVQSGLSIPQFCKEESLSESAFYDRKSKLKNAAAGFAQVKVKKLELLFTNSNGWIGSRKMPRVWIKKPWGYYPPGF